MNHNGAVILPGAPGLVVERCNIYGAETGGARFYQGETGHKIAHQWFCNNRADGHFRMTCAHGHKGQVMPLCYGHARAIKRRKVQFCPKCNVPPGDHRCALTITEIS